MANLRADNLTGTGGRNALDGSVAFLGDKDALQVPAGSDFAYGTGDFTIETWIRPQGVTSGESKGIFCQTQSGNDYVKFFIESDKTIKATFGSDTITGGKVEVASWSHVAVTRASNTVKVFVNGVASSGTSVTTDFTDTTRKPTIGQYTHTFGTLEYYGHISNFRIVKGTAVYTTDFTPPTEKLTAVDGTVLLCCQDSNDATQEATGKTITAYGNLDYSLRKDNLITNGDFDLNTTDGWTLASGSRALGTGQSGTFGDGNHLVLTGGSMYQAFTTLIGRTYLVNCQSNGADSSYISTSTSSGDAIITDIRNQNGNSKTGTQTFVATQTTYYVILTGGGGGGNFDTVSVYEKESPKAPKVFPPVGVDEGVVFEGDTKVNSQGYMYFPTGDTSQRGRGRAVFFSGNSAVTPAADSLNNTIDYIQIQSQGNAIDFGDMTHRYRRNAGGNASSSTRGMSVGGFRPSGSPSRSDTMMYITFATTGNANDFGNLSQAGSDHMGVSNETRGVFLGSIDASGNWLNIIDYVTIATTGNTTDFGDITIEAYSTGSGCSSPTRGVVGGGFNNTPATTTNKDYITYITIATTGNTSDFGNLTVARRGAMAASSAVRGVWAGGSSSPTEVNNIDYITIASTGDATDFGDLTPLNTGGGGSSNGTRGVFGGGYGTSPHPKVNVINRVEIATTGDAQDFGDLTLARANSASASDSHGGLS